MNIIKDFEEFKKYCTMRWENATFDSFYCHKELHACNEHVCPLISHHCKECNISTLEKLILKLCEYFNCSDANDDQYPKCNLWNTNKCEASKLFKRIEPILENLYDY